MDTKLGNNILGLPRQGTCTWLDWTHGGRVHCTALQCSDCADPATLTEASTRQCKVSSRAYHCRCLRDVEATAVAIDTEFECRQCRDNGHIPATLPLDLQLFRVEWEEHQEPIDSVRAWATADAARQLDELLEAQRCAGDQPQQKRQRQPDLSRAAIMPSPGETVYDVTLGNPLRKKLAIHTQPFNPHADIGLSRAARRTLGPWSTLMLQATSTH
jgi:hypothetical protein